MGEIADSTINGEMDFYTGEYIGRGVGYPRTLNRSLPWESTRMSSKAKQIKNELKMLIKKKQATCTTDKEKRHAVELARQEINKKYGHGWREK